MIAIIAIDVDTAAAAAAAAATAGVANNRLCVGQHSERWDLRVDEVHDAHQHLRRYYRDLDLAVRSSTLMSDCTLENQRD